MEPFDLPLEWGAGVAQVDSGDKYRQETRPVGQRRQREKGVSAHAVVRIGYNPSLGSGTVTDRSRQQAHPCGGRDGDRFTGLSGRVGETSERPFILWSECCRTARCGSGGKAS